MKTNKGELFFQKVWFLCAHAPEQLNKECKPTFILSLCYYLRTWILHTGQFLSSLLVVFIVFNEQYYGLESCDDK